jgi:hypothetical protein
MTEMGRLAMRHEGNMWNAYYAMSDTMDKAILLGSIKMTLVETPEMRDAFIAVMKQAITIAAKETLGVEMTWPSEPKPAPESERSGHG